MDKLAMNDPNQTRRGFLKALGVSLAALTLPGCTASATAPGKSAVSVQDRPNFVIIFTDDQGYQDVGCFGSENIKTQHLDRMAREGMRFTNFYAQTVCGPSRASLMTGCYPLRVAKRNNQVDVHPYLHTEEITVAEILRDVGYATGCFGKWDLAGHTQTDFDKDMLPTKQGFDYFFGTPSSNDRLVNLMRNDEVIEESADMNTLTRRYTDEAIAFIKASRDRPFFIYIPYTMPHTRLGVSAEFAGKSEGGMYGDVIEEIDYNAGRILDTVKATGLDERTYVIFLSDNGPWWIKKEHGGNALPLRGAKTSTWEGGVRVPCIMRAPGRIPAGGVCGEIARTMDVLPTLAKLAGGRVPADRVIDGRDIGALMHGQKGAVSPSPTFFYYQHTHLQAVRSGKWKLHLPRPANPPWTPNWARHIDPKDVFDIKKPMLFDLHADIGERRNVAGRHPKIVARLLELADQAKRDIGDYNRIGSGARFFDPQPKRPDIGEWTDEDA